MTILILFLISLPMLLFIHQSKHSKNGKPRKIPGPQGLPLIGNLHQLDGSNPHRCLWQLSENYGPLMSMRLGFVPTLVVSSAKMAKEVLKMNDLTFCSRPVFLGQQKLSYNNLDVAFSPYSKYWKEMRKICVLHLFSSKRVQSFRPARADEVSRMIQKISKLAASSKIVNLSEIVKSLTSAIICRIAFGKRYEDQGSERSRFNGLATEAQAVMGSFYFSDYFPMMGWVDKISGMCARLDKHFKEMDLFYQELIDEHLDPNRPQSMQEDIIDILLQLRKDQSSSFDLTLNHIKAVLMNIFLGGTGTSAVTVVWAMTGLMQNPRVMKKVQEEIRSFIGQKGVVDEDDVQNFPYLRAVIKEAMRLYPPAPLLIPRETMESCVIDGYEIPAKTLVYINAWAIGRDIESWENQEEFYPERFMDSDIDYRGNDFKLLPFGAGRRGCPGINLGASTVELTLSNLLYSFDWALPDGMKKEDIDFDVRPGVTMHKKTPLCLEARNYVH